MAKTVGGVLGLFLLGGLILLLTRSHPKPDPHPKERPKPAVSSATAGVRDAFEFAKDLEGRLRGEPKYAKVYLVPSAATANQKSGKVVVMGDIATDGDLRDLRALVAKDGVPVTLEWQVSVEHPAEPGSTR